ncbi:hypothetical protein ABH922_000184 [Rhodococcus sp. 27YEA15]
MAAVRRSRWLRYAGAGGSEGLTYDAVDTIDKCEPPADGLTLCTMDTNTEVAVAHSVGIPYLTIFGRIHHGGGAVAATIEQAAMAVAAGVGDVVVR